MCSCNEANRNPIETKTPVVRKINESINLSHQAIPKF